MILKSLFVSVIAFGIVNNLFAQTTDYKVQLPQILPASPEPTQFVKAGMGKVSMSTGGANASVPLYTIKIKDFSFPISLSYSTQGLKADEASTRVGFGWVLNATAMITRSVRGKPDEFAARMTIPDDFTAPMTQTDVPFYYCMDASSSTTGGDSQADEFQFNCNGYSGKFVLDNNYIPRVTATNNIKVDMNISVTPGSTSGNISTIVLTTPDGVRYSFGSAYEITTSHNLMAFSPYKNVTKTAFFLDVITLPTGETIQFNYSPINTSVSTGYTQTLQMAQVSGANQCGDCTGRNSYTSQEDAVAYRTSYLNSITTSTGISISFTYEPRTDVGGDNRLKYLDVTGLKKYQFSYYDVPIPSGRYPYTGRFFLTKIRDINFKDDPSLNTSLDYNFTYDHMTEVPLPITFSQDYLGYYNGKNNNCLIPPGLNSLNTIDFSFRNPDATYAQYGTLKSIQYPTSGTEEFIYEGNTYAATVKRNTFTTLELAGNGGTSGSIVYTGYINILRNQTITVDGYADDAILNDGYTEDPMAKTVKINIYDGTTQISSRQVLGYAHDINTVAVLAGHTYKIEMSVADYRTRGFCTVTYDFSDHDIYDIVNTAIPGIRVKQIKYYDPVASSSYSKYYKYATLDNLDVSTGGLYGAVAFRSDAVQKTFCGQYGEWETICNVNIYSSSSTNEVYNNAGSGSLIYYKTLIESDDPNFANGGTEYTFYNNETGSNFQQIMGVDVPYLSSGQSPTLSGYVYKKRLFNKNQEIVQVEQDDYESRIYMDHMVQSVYVRKRYEPWATRPDRMDVFDIIKMQYGNWWYLLKTKTVITYSGGTALTQKTDYTYGTPDNILPQTTVTTDSKGVAQTTENKYPTDFPSDPVFAKMITRNIISPVVQLSSKQGGTLLQQKYHQYKDWFNDSKILMTEIVQVKESPDDVLHNVLLYNQYDSKGNALQLQKADNISLAYLWDNLHGTPVCEIQNATTDQVAYTSFEDNVYGNWQVISGSAGTAAGFTGNQSFTGSIQKTIAIGGNYNVTLWTTDNATVNGANGILLRTVNGWKLYQWVLSNPAVVTVQGTNIDEVRLLPSTAFITSFTYIPFIGISSKNDVNNNVTYFEYDGFNRLLRIRDIDKNIIKQYNYQYQVAVVGQWQVTGNVRCVKDAANNNTGEQEREEKDLNPASGTYNTLRWVSNGLVCSACQAPANWVNTANTQCEVYEEFVDGTTYTGNLLQEQKEMSACSPTYNQTRWISLGCSGSCVPADMWTATGNKRCIKDASGINTGEQEKEEKNNNPCSATYNQTRWVYLGYVCAECAATTAANWQPTGATRCATNSSGQTTGEQQREEKDINHCSGTYNQSRWISLGQNCSACAITSCTGANQKVINCQCEYGTRVNSSSVYMKVNNPAGDPPQIWIYRCTYHYVFPDCSVSPNYTEDRSTPCTVASGCILD